MTIEKDDDLIRQVRRQAESYCGEEPTAYELAVELCDRLDRANLEKRVLVNRAIVLTEENERLASGLSHMSQAVAELENEASSRPDDALQGHYGRTPRLYLKEIAGFCKEQRSVTDWQFERDMVDAVHLLEALSAWALSARTILQALDWENIGRDQIRPLLEWLKEE